MAYNHAAAEREWLRWKTKEEAKMRELGVDEDTIQRLHFYDWEAFKAERNYQSRQQPADETIQVQKTEMEELPVKDAESLLDSIEDEQLLGVLKKADKLTLEILVLKTKGYSGPEISRRLGLPEMAINNRVSRLRKKLKKIF